jgi:predicted lactoylglutathione lyase
MFDLPKSKLGDVPGFTIASPDLEKSYKYYMKLGFKEKWQSDYPFKVIQITDGNIQITLRYDIEPYIAMSYYVKDLDKIVNELEKDGIEFSYKSQRSEFIKRYIFQSPDGINISLVIWGPVFDHQSDGTMLLMDQNDYNKPEKYVNKVCGMFGEFAHPVKDINTSILFWQRLGFTTLSKFESPYPWAILSDGLHAIGLHQTEDFNYPAITYYATDMKQKIEKLKNEGLENFAEFMGENNIVLTTPENQHIFLFSLGM